MIHKPRQGRALLFECRGQIFFVDSADVHGVHGNRDSLPVPDLDPDCVGLLPNGTRCYDLAGLLGGERRARPRTSRIVVVSCQGGAVGLLTDRIHGPVVYSADRLKDLPQALGDVDHVYSRVLVHEGNAVLGLRLESFHPEGFSGRSRPEPATFEIAEPAHASPDAHNSAARGVLIFKALATSESEPPLYFGLSFTQVAEVVEYPTPQPIAAAPPMVEGLVLWRDRPVTIVSFGARFGGQSTGFRPSRLVIATVGNQLLGIPCSGTQALELPLECTLIDEPTPIAPELCLGAFEMEGSRLVVPNLERSFCR